MASIERYLKVKTQRREIDSLKSSFSAPKKLRKNGSSFGKKKPTKKRAQKKKSSKPKARTTAQNKTGRDDKKIIGDGSAPMKRK